MRRLPLLLASAVLLVACGEKAQTATGRKADDKPWELANTAYAAASRASGQAAWEQQLTARNQGQNEYKRTGAH